MKDMLFSRANFVLFGLCAVLLVAGYMLLSQGQVPVAEGDNHLSRSVAPAVLVAVYCILIPFAILYGYGRKKDTDKAAKKVTQ
ncbi:MAG: hypothetical protein LBU70_03475 [Chitinispirillales bacterium]|nr:hypothetical protein [Chitinispirillales bacterium]